MNNNPAYIKLNTWIPVNYSSDRHLSLGEKAANSFENYFYLGGKRASILRTNGNTLEVNKPVVQHQALLLTALKIASYLTVIIPLIMLIGKAIFRARHDIKFQGTVIDNENFIVDPHQEAKDLRGRVKNVFLQRSEEANSLWLKYKINNDKSKKYIYSMQRNGEVRIQHVEKQLGKGGFGKVKLLHDIETGRRTALKIANPVEDSQGQLLIEESEKLHQIQLKTESEFIQKPPLSDVVTVRRMYEKRGNKPHRKKAFEAVAYDGSLKDLLQKNLSLQLRLNIVDQLVQGVRDLHLNGIAHNDLKPDNILYLKNNYRIVIIDLSGAVFEGSDLTKIQYTPAYTNGREVAKALEAPSDISFDARKLLDIRALGITIFQILTQIDFSRTIEQDLAQAIGGTKYKNLRDIIVKMIGEEVEIKEGVLSQAPGFIKTGLRFIGAQKLVDSKIKTDRPSIEEVCEVVADLQ